MVRKQINEHSNYIYVYLSKANTAFVHEDILIVDALAAIESLQAIIPPLYIGSPYPDISLSDDNIMTRLLRASDPTKNWVTFCDVLGLNNDTSKTTRFPDVPAAKITNRTANSDVTIE